MALKAKVPSVGMGTNHAVVFSQFDEVWEAPAGEPGGLYLRSNGSHPARGAVFFYPDPGAAPLREALGLPAPPAPKP